jgi:hypothetical protein
MIAITMVVVIFKCVWDSIHRYKRRAPVLQVTNQLESLRQRIDDATTTRSL